MTLALAAARSAHLACLMVVFGAESMTALWRARLGAHDGLPRRLIVLLSLGALASAGLVLLLTSASLTASADAAALATVLTKTLFGRAMCLRLVLLALLAAASVLPARPLVRVLISGAALAAIALSSHAAAAGAAAYLPLRAANDGVHLIAAGFWVGGLAVLARMVLDRTASDESLVPAVRLFSGTGLLAVAVLVVAGTINAVLILFAGGGRWSPAYLSVLAAKLVLPAVMISLALANRFGLLPGLKRGEKEVREQLSLSVVAELVAGIAVIAVVGFLGLLSPTV
ncbi:MAG: CopD family protein [Alphaproteobacteria bacterium]|nr:CopD family protein [Alphaproteobacteria bacterium]